MGNSTLDCYIVRRAYHSKVQKGEIIQAVEKNRLPSHKSILTCTAVEENPEPIVVHESGECSTELTKKKKELVDSLIKSKVFRNLFEYLEFGEQAQKEVTKVILEVYEKFGEQCYVISKAVRKVARPNLDTLTFSRKDAQTIGFSHNKPLYVEAKVNSLTFRRALVDNGSLVNIMSSHVFKAAGIPERKLVSSNVPLVTFASSSYKTKGYVNLDLQARPIRTPTKFYVIDAEVSYHLLLGRPWIHKNYAVPSTLHQCVKAIRGKEIFIPATKAPFSQEVHWVESTFFDDIYEGLDEVRPRGAALITHEEDYDMERSG